MRYNINRSICGPFQHMKFELRHYKDIEISFTKLQEQRHQCREMQIIFLTNPNNQQHCQSSTIYKNLFGNNDDQKR